MVSQPFLYICRAIYNSNGGGYHTRVYLQYFLYTIFSIYISTFYNTIQELSFKIICLKIIEIF